MNTCIKCKGRGWCGHKCTIYAKLKFQKRANLNFKQDFYGKTPNIFVGRFGHPNVNVGFLSTDFQKYDQNDNPLLWSKENYSIDKVVGLRSDLVNSSYLSNVYVGRKSVQDKFMELSQEVSLSKKAVDTELNLKDKPQFRLSFNQDAAPHGPSVKLKKAAITEHVRVPKKIDKVVSDYDFKAAGAIKQLSKNFDEHYLTKLLSVGNLGVKKQRSLVPTRWAITAVDDIVGKDLVNEVKDFSKQMDYFAYFGGHLGNYFLVLFFPDVWSYELFETYLPKSLYNKSDHVESTSDHEFFSGRKEYAKNCAGGYYAARLPVLEFMRDNHRQGTCVTFRFITDEYWAPLGVWVVRESVRKALESKGLNFSSKELMLTYAKKLVKKRFGYNLDILINKSEVLTQMKKQKKLFDF